jgi:mRNA degradation ribonuclease J1/J2
MVLLPFTNIIVDEFSHCKKNKSIKYVHFLTHMHSDHFVGMSEGWNHGRIYCTQISANLLLHKFTNVK